MREIVVDTNVFAHTANPNVTEYGPSVAFCQALNASDVVICTDEGFSLVEAQNRSKICHEYLTHIPATSVGYLILTALTLAGRVVTKPKRVDDANRRAIEQLVYDVSDRVFVQVAANSADRELVSNDLVGYPDSARKAIKRRVGVTVVEAATPHALRLCSHAENGSAETAPRNEESEGVE